MVICRSWNSPTCIQSHILRCSDTLHSAVHTISYTGNSSIPVWNTQDRPNICIRHTNTNSMCQSSKPNSTEIPAWRSICTWINESLCDAPYDNGYTHLHLRDRFLWSKHGCNYLQKSCLFTTWLSHFWDSLHILHLNQAIDCGRLPCDSPLIVSMQLLIVFRLRVCTTW